MPCFKWLSFLYKLPYSIIPLVRYTIVEARSQTSNNMTNIPAKMSGSVRNI